MIRAAASALLPALAETVRFWSGGRRGVLVVHDGRVVEDGTPAELIGGGGRFAKLHGAWKDSLV